MIPPALKKSEYTIKLKKPLPTDGPICLNLGGAGEGFLSGRIPGFMTVDLRDIEDTDIVSDISDLSFCADGTVDKIYCSNALEHFPHPQTKEVLKEWYRALKHGGKAYISVPDFEASVKLFQTFGLTDWVKFLIWGDQAHHLNYHYVNFTFATLASECYEAGFFDIKRLGSMPFGVHDASEHRDNRLKIKISLNVEVTK